MEKEKVIVETKRFKIIDHGPNEIYGRFELQFGPCRNNPNLTEVAIFNLNGKSEGTLGFALMHEKTTLNWTLEDYAKGEQPG